jgi:hypothetical protein
MSIVFWFNIGNIIHQRNAAPSLKCLLPGFLRLYPRIQLKGKTTPVILTLHLVQLRRFNAAAPFLPHKNNGKKIKLFAV